MYYIQSIKNVIVKFLQLWIGILLQCVAIAALMKLIQKHYKRIVKFYALIVIRESDYISTYMIYLVK